MLLGFIHIGTITKRSARLIAIYFFTAFWSCCTWGQAQNKKIYLSIIGKDAVETQQIHAVQDAKAFRTFQKMLDHLESTHHKLVSLGYLDLESNPIQKVSDSTYSTQLRLNTKYKVLRFHCASAIAYLEQFRIPPNSVAGNHKYNYAIAMDQTSRVIAGVSTALHRRGHPFHKIQFADIFKQKDTVFATLHIDNGKYRRLDKLKLKGYNRFPSAFLRNFLKLKTGQTFDKKEIMQQLSAINQLDFVSEIKPAEVQFQKDSTVVYLYLKKEPTNQIQGFLGFSNNQRKNFELFGNIDLNLKNNLNFGESLKLHYQNDKQDQEQFRLQFIAPYLLGSPIGLRGELAIFRRDSTFVTTTQAIQATYSFSPKFISNIGYLEQSSGDLRSNKEGNAKTEIGSYNSNYLTLGFSYFALMQDLFHTKSQNYTVNFQLGRRNTLDNFSNFQIRAETTAYQIWVLNHSQRLFFRLSASFLSSKKILSNELFQFGGIRSIRGFDENSISASVFGICNTEYQYLVASNLYVHSVLDFSYFEDDVRKFKDQLISFGFGLGLQTKSGLFRILAANGKSINGEFLWDNTKIHFSISTKF